MFGQRFPSLGKVRALTEEVEKRTAVRPPRIVTVLGCQEDEVWTTSNGAATVTADTVNYKINGIGWKLTADSANTRGYYVDCRVASAAVDMPPASTLSLWIYVPEPTKITDFQIEWYYDATHYRQIRFPTSGSYCNITEFAVGWNLLRMPLERFRTNDSDVTDYFGTLQTLKFYLITNDATEVTIGHMYLECPEKAQVLFIQDGGYSDFYTNAYPAMKARGIPCTWAIQPSKIGTAGWLTLAQVLALANENNNSISFNSWGGAKLTNDMTAGELRADCMQCIKWLERNGLTGGIWRAAWLQNLAPQAPTCQNLFWGFAMYDATGGGILNVYPFIKPYGINRIALHAYNATPSNMDALFTMLEMYHGLMVCYTHNVSADGSATDLKAATWTHFLDKCTTGINAGWLEGITFEDLVARSGITSRQTYGDWVTEYMTEIGARASRRLP